MYKKILLISVLFVTFTFSSCKNEDTNNHKQEKTDRGLALRKGDLFSEDIDLGEKAVVEANAPGNNETEARAFENAPPIIPHKTDGFYPITKQNNACLSCHMPAVANAMKTTSIPVSHFTNYRPNVEESGNKVLYAEANSNKVVAKELGDKLNHARYNCNQCHVTQTNATLDVKNNFKADFRNDSDKNKSNLNDVITEGVK